MATIIGCLLRASIGVHTERKIRDQISVFTIRKNPQISLSVFQQQNRSLQSRTPRTCKTLHYWQSQESQDRTGSFERQSVNTRKRVCIYFVLTFIFLSFLEQIWSTTDTTVYTWVEKKMKQTMPAKVYPVPECKCPQTDKDVVQPSAWRQPLLEREYFSRRLPGEVLVPGRCYEDDTFMLKI